MKEIAGKVKINQGSFPKPLVKKITDKTDTD